MYTIFEDFLKKAYQENGIFTIFNGKTDLTFLPVRVGSGKLLYTFENDPFSFLNDAPKLVAVISGGRLISRGLENFIEIPEFSDTVISFLSYGKILNETEVRDYVQSVYDNIEPIYPKDGEDYPVSRKREFLSEDEVLEVICGADVGALVEKKLDREKIARLKGMELLAEKE
jgi:hypothetical protein